MRCDSSTATIASIGESMIPASVPASGCQPGVISAGSCAAFDPDQHGRGEPPAQWAASATPKHPDVASVSAKLVIDANLIRKYGGHGPPYTSSHTADSFVEALDAAAYRHWLQNRNVGGFVRPLGLYVHLPFCGTLCYYCACNKIITKDRGKPEKYLKYLGREARLIAGTLGEDRAIGQLHWGGGTPTFLSDAELAGLMDTLRAEFAFAAQGEYAVEVDPRTVDAQRVALLARLG